MVRNFGAPTGIRAERARGDWARREDGTLVGVYWLGQHPPGVSTPEIERVWKNIIEASKVPSEQRYGVAQ